MLPLDVSDLTPAWFSSVLGLDVQEKSGAFNAILGPSIGYEYTMDLGLAFGAESFLFYDFADGRAGPLGVFGTVRVWF